MNIHPTIETGHKPTHYDRTVKLDWTLNVVRGGVCLFESDCLLSIVYWPFDEAQDRMGDDFGFEVESITFANCAWASKDNKTFTVTPKSDPVLYALCITELDRVFPELNAAIAAEIAELDEADERADVLWDWNR